MAQATGGRGVDRVVEVDMAGNAELLPKIVAQDGLCVAYGSNAPDVTFGFLPMILRGPAVRFFIVYELADADRNHGIADISGWLEAGQVCHLPIAVYRLEDIVEAHEHAEAGAAPGKIVLAPR